MVLLIVQFDYSVTARGEIKVHVTFSFSHWGFWTLINN